MVANDFIVNFVMGVGDCVGSKDPWMNYNLMNECGGRVGGNVY